MYVLYGVREIVCPCLIPRFNKAIAGVGKTILRSEPVSVCTDVNSSIAFEHLKQTFDDVDDVALACVYFNYKEPATLTEIVASVLKQVSERAINLPQEVKSLYEYHRRRDTRPTLAELSSLLGIESARLKTCFFMLDALDECTAEENTGVKIVSELHKMPNARFMITSRPHVVKLLSKHRAVKLEIRARDEDIRRSLESLIADSYNLSEFVQTDEGLRRTVIDTVVTRANGM
jgi:hypothetical protein